VGHKSPGSDDGDTSTYAKNWEKGGSVFFDADRHLSQKRVAEVAPAPPAPFVMQEIVSRHGRKRTPRQRTRPDKNCFSIRIPRKLAGFKSYSDEGGVGASKNARLIVSKSSGRYLAFKCLLRFFAMYAGSLTMPTIFLIFAAEVARLLPT
jgi:hypothetical protein